MSWDNPVFPKAAKNSIGFLVPFFLSYPRVVGGSEKCVSKVVRPNYLQAFRKQAILKWLYNRKWYFVTKIVLTYCEKKLF